MNATELISACAMIIGFVRRQRRNRTLSSVYGGNDATLTEVLWIFTLPRPARQRDNPGAASRVGSGKDAVAEVMQARGRKCGAAPTGTARPD